MNHYVRLISAADSTLMVDVHARPSLPAPGTALAMAGVSYELSTAAPSVKIERVDLGGQRAVEVHTFRVVRTGAAPLPPATIPDPSKPPKPVRFRATKLNRKRRARVTSQPPVNIEPAAPAAETPIPEQPQPEAPMRAADLPADAVVARFRSSESRAWVGPIIGLRRALQVGEIVQLLGETYGVRAFEGGSLVEWGGRRFDLKTAWVAQQHSPAKQPSFVYP